MKKADLIGICIAVCLFIFLALRIPSTSCHDGWQSPSIGSRGACSHHGGVNDYSERWFLAFIFSGFSGICIRLVITGREEKLAEDFRISKLTDLEREKHDKEKILRSALIQPCKVQFVYEENGDDKPLDVIMRPIRFMKQPLRLGADVDCIVGLCGDDQTQMVFSISRIKEPKLVYLQKGPNTKEIR